MMNTVIVGKLIRTSLYELELEVKEGMGDLRP
jgi:hypothetical protein